MQVDKRLDAYAELPSRYARNLVSLEHGHMVSRGKDSGYFEVAKLELRARKIVNRMDKIVAGMMQDNAYRQQAQFQTYPIPTITPISQMISSPAEVDKISAATLQEAEEIMAIAYPSGTQPPVAVTDTTTTQTTQSMPSTATLTTTATTAADRLDHGRTNRPASPSFTMTVAMENHPGVTANPLLMVNTGNNGNTNSFVTPTVVTNRKNRQDNRNTVVFHNNVPKADKWINISLAEIANQDQRKLQRPTAMTAQFPTGASLQTTVNTSIRVCIQIRTDQKLTITIDTTIITGKATLTEPVTIVA